MIGLPDVELAFDPPESSSDTFCAPLLFVDVFEVKSVVETAWFDGGGGAAIRTKYIETWL